MTLEEVAEADVILHVRDISHPESDAQKADVLEVLAEMGLGDDRRIIEVMNKTDLLGADEKKILAEKLARNGAAVAVSAATGEGCGDLLTMLSDILSDGRFCHRFQIDCSDGAALAWLYAHGHVVDRRQCERYVTVEVSLEPADAARFERRFSAKSL